MTAKHEPEPKYEYIQAVPFYTRADADVFAWFTEHLDDLDSMTGDALTVMLPDSVKNGEAADVYKAIEVKAVDAGGKLRPRYPGLKRADLPCLWIEGTGGKHFKLPLPREKDQIGQMLRKLSDAAEASRSIDFLREKVTVEEGVGGDQPMTTELEPEYKYFKAIPFYTRDHVEVFKWFAEHQEYLKAMPGPGLRIMLLDWVQNGDPAVVHGKLELKAVDADGTVHPLYPGVGQNNLPCFRIEGPGGNYFTMPIPQREAQIDWIVENLSLAAEASQSIDDLQNKVKPLLHQIRIWDRNLLIRRSLILVGTFVMLVGGPLIYYFLYSPHPSNLIYYFLYSPHPSKRTILILAANPKGTEQLQLITEVKQIREGLRRSNLRDEFKVESVLAVTDDDLRRALLEYEPEIVHFSGHGTGSGQSGSRGVIRVRDADETGGLVFEGDSGQPQLISGGALSRVFELCSGHVKCVLLNACYSEVQAEAIRQHIDYVIGMRKEIGDAAAIKFALGFYDALGAGCDYDTAFKWGQSAIDLKGLPGYLTPVLKKKPSLVQPPSSARNS